MSFEGEPRRARPTRERAQDLTEAAERTSDPEHRQRLKDKARRLQGQSQQDKSEGGEESGPG